MGAAGVGLLLNASLMGCGSGGGISAKATPVPVPTPSSMEELRFPLDAYAVPDSQLAQEQVLVKILTESCMQKFGFLPKPVIDISGTLDRLVRTWEHMRSRRYGISDRKSASTYGFRLPNWMDALPVKSLDSRPVQELAVLEGRTTGAAGSNYRGIPIPPGGCRGEAYRLIYKERPSGEGLIKKISALSFQRLESDPRARAVSAKWSKCMSRKGYNYPDPWHSGDGFYGEDGEAGPSGSQNPTPAELKAAVAHVDCTYETNVLGVMFAVESDFQNVEIEKNADALNEEKKRLEAHAKQLQEMVKRYGVQ